MDPMTSLPLRITPLTPLNKVTKDPSASLFCKKEREGLIKRKKKQRKRKKATITHSFIKLTRDSIKAG